MEMPGLRLTPVQVERLCGIEQQLCRTVLATLVERNFLRLTVNGIYGRVTDGEMFRPRVAKVNLRGDQRSATAS